MYSADARTNLTSFSTRPRGSTRAGGRGHAAQSAASANVSAYYRWKGVTSRALAAVLLVPGTFLVLPLLFLVWISSPGPVIYTQRRVGAGGRVFTMYKIRTMRHDAEARSGPVWSTEDDPRVTRVGWLLRTLHLDELPQLVNVIRGEMDLFGPRPERPEFVELLSRQISGYEKRLTVRPGVSGLAQINLPPDTDLHSVRRKIVLDEYYIENAGLLLDARMFVCTLLRMVGIPGDWAMHALRLDYSGLLSSLPVEEPESASTEDRRGPIPVPTPWRDFYDSHEASAKSRQRLTPALAFGKGAVE